MGLGRKTKRVLRQAAKRRKLKEKELQALLERGRKDSGIMAKVLNDVDNGVENLINDEESLKLNGNEEPEYNSIDEPQRDAFTNLRRIQEINNAQKIRNPTPVVEVLTNGHSSSDDVTKFASLSNKLNINCFNCEIPLGVQKTSGTTTNASVLDGINPSKAKENGTPKEEEVQSSTIEIDSGLSTPVVSKKSVASVEQNGCNDENDSKGIVDDKDSDIISISDTPEKRSGKKKLSVTITPRRSTRNVNKPINYKDDDCRDDDVEEVVAIDPLADDSKLKSNNKAIIVNNTKSLIEFASNARNFKEFNKNEPTLVIIDTKSILSGRGPVPVCHSSNSTTLLSTIDSKSSKSVSVTSSNVPSNSSRAYSQYKASPSQPRPLTLKQPTSTVASKHMKYDATHSVPAVTKQPEIILPSLTDDMFVVEAPSFIVPYVYEKPAIKELKEQIELLRGVIKKDDGKEEEHKESVEEITLKKESDKNAEIVSQPDRKKSAETREQMNANAKNNVEGSKNEKNEDEKAVQCEKKDEKMTESKKPATFFDSPIGKFFLNIGLNLVQERVQTNLLRSQKRKRPKDGAGYSAETNKSITMLTKTLECSKETNSPYKMELKKCELCGFCSESSLVMAHHAEMPHLKNYKYRCTFCSFEIHSPYEILRHMEMQHNVRGRLESPYLPHRCFICPFEDNQKNKLTRHLMSCMKKYQPDKNQEPPLDWEPPAKLPRYFGNRTSFLNPMYQPTYQRLSTASTKLMPNMDTVRPQLANMSRKSNVIQGYVSNQFQNVSTLPINFNQRPISAQTLNPAVYRNVPLSSTPQITTPQDFQMARQNQNVKHSSLNIAAATKFLNHSNISITPLHRTCTSSATSGATDSSFGCLKAGKPLPPGEKSPLVVCEICDGFIKNLDGLRNHMLWVHKVKIHPKMIYNRPPLNCQKCQYRFFTDQGLERHLLGSHGLVTSSMQEAATKSKDGGRCPICGRVYQWKLLNHVARDHQMGLKPAHLSYKCTVCTATFGMYKQFESHVYSAHSVVAKNGTDSKKTTPTSSSIKQNALLKPLKINDEITIIPQPMKSTRSASRQSVNANTRKKDEYCLRACVLRDYATVREFQNHLLREHVKPFKIKVPRCGVKRLDCTSRRRMKTVPASDRWIVKKPEASHEVESSTTSGDLVSLRLLQLSYDGLTPENPAPDNSEPEKPVAAATVLLSPSLLPPCSKFKGSVVPKESKEQSVDQNLLRKYKAKPLEICLTNYTSLSEDFVYRVTTHEDLLMESTDETLLIPAIGLNVGAGWLQYKASHPPQKRPPKMIRNENEETTPSELHNFLYEKVIQSTVASSAGHTAVGISEIMQLHQANAVHFHTSMSKLKERHERTLRASNVLLSPVNANQSDNTTGRWNSGAVSRTDNLSVQSLALMEQVQQSLGRRIKSGVQFSPSKRKPTTIKKSFSQTTKGANQSTSLDVIDLLSDSDKEDDNKNDKVTAAPFVNHLSIIDDPTVVQVLESEISNANEEYILPN